MDISHCLYVKTNPFIVRERMKKRTRKVNSNKMKYIFKIKQ